MNYNTLRNKPTINYRELIGDSAVSEVGGITEQEFNTLMNTDLASYYTKAQIDNLFSRSYVYREKSGSIVTFDCPSTPQSIPELTAEIVAVQSGTGDASPTNVRPITGWSAVNVYDGPTTEPLDATTYTTTLKDGNNQPLTCYGGELDVINGVLTVDRAIVDMGTLNWVYNENANVFGSNQFTPYVLTNGKLTCSQYKWNSTPNVSPTNLNNGEISASPFFNRQTVMVKDTRFTDATDFKTAMNGVQLVYELATPQTIPQDSLSIATQEGTNNLWADSGDITVKALDKIIQG